MGYVRGYLFCVFLSTLSLRRATFEFNAVSAHITISIHALLAESDFNSTRVGVSGTLFLSTLSLRRATLFAKRFSNSLKFLSTLSLRRATGTLSDTSDVTANFYPRSPCGERHNTSFIQVKNTPFLSTLSLRRATASPEP